MKKLLLCAVLMLSLSTFAQGKEKTIKFNKEAFYFLGLSKDDDLEWNDSKGKFTLFKDGENKAEIEYGGDTDIYKIVSVDTEAKDFREKKCDKFVVEGKDGTQSTIYVYDKKKDGACIYMKFMTLDTYILLKK